MYELGRDMGEGMEEESHQVHMWSFLQQCGSGSKWKRAMVAHDIESMLTETMI
jgi:hypothetical protein